MNPAQIEAVRTLSGPLLVLAGAGTGKTRVVTYRIANLIREWDEAGPHSGGDVYEEGGGEMQQRAAALLTAKGRRVERRGRRRGGEEEDAPPRPEISTFHSLCVRILRRHIKQLGYPEKFVICDRGRAGEPGAGGAARVAGAECGACAGRFVGIYWAVEVGGGAAGEGDLGGRTANARFWRRPGIGGIRTI